MKNYNSKIISEYVKRILENFAVPTTKARITAELLVEADLRGIYSHGINNLESLVISSIKARGTNPKAMAIDLTKNSRLCIRHIDANGGLGHFVAMQAVDLAKSLARKYGMGKVYVFNANHFGVAAIYSEKISQDKDLAGRVTCTTPALMKPYGGTKNRLGTNPIAMSIPYDKGIVTIDMATTIHAASEINRAILERLPLPFPVLDENGNETISSKSFNSPMDFLKKGSMIPLGGLGKEKSKKADAGYKGSGLAILIELDNVIGGGRSVKIDPMVNDNSRRIRQTFEAYRIDSLFSKKQVIKQISDTINDIKKYGGADMLMPGEKEQNARTESLKNGISYSDMQIKRLIKLGQEVGIANFTEYEK